MKNAFLTFVLVGVAVVLTYAAVDQSPQIADLESRLGVAESRIQYLEQQEFIRAENDKVILLHDPVGFVAKGIVGLSEEPAAKVTSIVDNNGNPLPKNFEYLITGRPGLLDVSTGDWYPIDIRKGETVSLQIYGVPDGTKYVGYYLCYTNSATCRADTQITPIVVSEDFAY